MSKDVSSDWFRPHLEAWAHKLGDHGATVATLSLPAAATLNDYYINATKGSRVLGGQPATGKYSGVSFNAITETIPDHRREAQDQHMASNSITRTLESIQHNMMSNSRALSNRLMAIEANDGRSGIECSYCHKPNHTASVCRTNPANDTGRGFGPPRGGRGGRGRGGGRGGSGGRGGGPPGRDTSHITCYNCNALGHYSGDCTKPCGLCQETSHTSASCPTRQPQGTKRPSPDTAQSTAGESKKNE
jgi:hypothetical protein